MRFLHLSDLHLGKQLCGFSLYEEQKFMLTEIIQTAEEEKVDAILIAGDIYDKTAPSGEAMLLFSDFISELTRKKISVYIISGNHDSAQRISYFSDIIRTGGVYVSDEFDGRLQSFCVEDAFGKIKIHMLPFIKPVNVRKFYPDDEIESYADAVRKVLENTEIDFSERNILLCHQYITGSEKSGSEAMSVGSLENIPSSCFAGFDYVAMGHIHRSQTAGRREIRYCGTPMKYDAAEAFDKKVFTVVDIKDKGDLSIETKPVELLRDIIKVEGKFNELMNREKCDDYAIVTITDENTVPDAAAILRQVFPKMISFGIKNSKTEKGTAIKTNMKIDDMSPVDLFCDFFKMMNNDIAPSESQIKLINEVIEQAGGALY